MDTPNTRSTKEVILKDTYVTGGDKNEVKKAEKFLEFISTSMEGLEEINLGIENLDHVRIGEQIQALKPAILSMGYASLYSAATALENEFIHQMITDPRSSLEDFMTEIGQAVVNVNTQLEGMRVSMI